MIKVFDQLNVLLSASQKKKFIILFFLMKYTRLKEFGLDRPGILFFGFVTYLSFKYKNILASHQSDIIILTLIISLNCLVVIFGLLPILSSNKRACFNVLIFCFSASFFSDISC